MNFCSNCGAATIRRVPEGDNRPRDLCDHCGMIHYQNPKIIAGCVVLDDNKVLLCRRAIEPRYGLWTLPAGFMENGETVLKHFERDVGRGTCNSRARAIRRLRFQRSSSLHALPCFLTNGQYESGPESLETRLFGMDEIPWDELAFHSTRYISQTEGRSQTGVFSLHCIDRDETPVSARV